jgi:hypothetical protein
MTFANHVVFTQADIEKLAGELGVSYDVVFKRYGDMLIDGLGVFEALLDPNRIEEVKEFQKELEGLKRRPETLG